MNKKIVLFDDVCNFCNTTIQLIIKNDKKDIFRFASLQSDRGKQLIKELGIDTCNLDSFILIENKNFHSKSNAAILIVKEFGFFWSGIQFFTIFPKKIRDAMYDFIAKNRYKILGKSNSCMIPSPELRQKFL